MDTTRRNFLMGAVAASAIATVGVSLPAALPVLHGDGKTDDAPAFKAMMDGDLVSYRGRLYRAMEGKTFYLPPGEYALSEPLTITRPLTWAA